MGETVFEIPDSKKELVRELLFEVAEVAHSNPIIKDWWALPRWTEETWNG